MRRLLIAICLFLIPCQTFAATDNIVVLLDTSGSMAEGLRSVHKSKIEAAQDVLINVLSKVPDSTNIGILTFNGWIYQPGPLKVEQLESAIRSTHASGGTPLWQCMQMAATELLKMRQSNGNVGNYKILVVTDGMAGDTYLAEDHPEKIGYLTDILRRGIIVDCIGVNMDQDHDLATNINGNYMRADNPESLLKAVAKSVSEVGATSPDVTTECYDTMKQLPDNFAKDVIQGLSKYENQPIGEVAPVEVINKDGTVTVVPPPPSPQAKSSGGWVIVGLIAGGIILIVVILAIACNSNY